ncbi:Bypass of stop codon protein 6 like [Verticillium longisporum]|nr:Bypass of stop codon protein 6 like [Verticillium longisporum]
MFIDYSSAMATTTIELEPVQAHGSHDISANPSKPSSPHLAPTEHRTQAIGDEEPQGLSRATKLKLLAAGVSFFVSGTNDGSIGALVPYFIRDYELSTAVASVVYGANFLGWLFAAFTNTYLTQRFGLGGLLVFGAALQVVAHALRSWKPPFPFFCITFAVVCLGQAYQDTGCNTYVAGAKGAHRWLAFIHAMYMAGCFVAPFIATAVASAGTTSYWYLYYTFPLALGVGNLALACYAFRDTIHFRGRLRSGANNTPNAETQLSGSTSEPTKGAAQLVKETLSNKSVWAISAFFFFYIGGVLTAVGWIVEFLVEVRDGNLAHMGYVPAGFSGGGLLGRILLAEPTFRLGERRMVFIYCVLALAFQLVFWLVPHIVAASVAVSLVGFFTGPLFATGISIGSKLFPREIQSTALSFIFLFAQMGGAFFPIITGALALRYSVGVLQPMLVALFACMTISWVLIPRVKQSNNTGLHHE